MPTVDLSSYHQPSGTAADGTKYDNLIDAVQTALNGLDTNNLAPAAGITAGQLAAGVVGLSRICDFTATGSVASLDTNTILGGNIPATYSQLMLMLSLRGDTAAVNVNVNVRLNNDSAADYYDQFVQVSGGTVSGSEGLATTSFTSLAAMPAATALANEFGIAQLVFADYTNTARFKNVVATNHLRWANSAGGHVVRTAGGEWAATPAAVNRITVLPSAGNWVTGSRLTLYGMV